MHNGSLISIFLCMLCILSYMFCTLLYTLQLLSTLLCMPYILTLHILVHTLPTHKKHKPINNAILVEELQRTDNLSTIKACTRKLELVRYLNMEHEVPTIEILHHEE